MAGPQQGKQSGQAAGQAPSQAAGGGQSAGLQRQQGGRQLGRYGAAGGGFGPFSMMRRMMEDMDRLFEDFGFGGALSPFGQPRSLAPQGGGRALSSSVGGLWSPHIEVSEREGQILVKADLPGVARDDVRVELLEDALLIEGERRQEHQEQRGGMSYTERSYGTFARTIPVPQGVQPDDVNATFENGVLEIALKLPQQQQRGRTVQIKAGGASSAQGAGSNGNQATPEKGQQPS
ncbi:Hsp20/alpha crystallin family protein [Sorangium sp. So ce131]|uniref:Hsp20/alpha crystallin family protein n=1 Tax=Sorangium sp. So ce131 TaxID=3133282 RepID=UPI003F5FBDF5